MDNYWNIIWLITIIIFIVTGVYQSTKEDISSTEEDLADKAENERLAKEAEDLNEGFKN